MSDAQRDTGGGTDRVGRVPTADEADALFRQLESRLDAITSAPVVRKDATAQRLIAEMARTADIEEILELLDQLNARITTIRQRRGAASPIASESSERARRTVLRL